MEAEVEQIAPLPTALLALPAIETTVNVETAPEAAPLATVTSENDDLIMICQYCMMLFMKTI
jgi:hypothetical protein